MFLKNPSRTMLPATVAACALSLLLGACGRKAPEPDPGLPPAAASAAASGANSGAASASPVSAPGPAASAPPVVVTTVRAQKRDVPITVEATGAVTPEKAVDIKPQMSSVVTRVHVKDGQFVRAGEPLFTLDARADEANVAKLRAQMARDEAALADAQRQLTRSRELVAMKFVSQAAVDSSQSVVDAQVAAVNADRAAMDAAKVSLSYARLVAPLAGRVGVVNVSVGSAVVANQTTLLTITQVDPIDVSFSVPQRILGDALAALATGKAPVTATLPDSPADQGVATGRLVFVDSSVDATSGTVKVKARFANREQKLWPGAYVKTSMTVRTLTDAVVVPMASVVQGARGTFVYAVVDGKATPRPVEVLQAMGEEAAVRGVKPGENLVLDGRQNVRPGSTVIVRPREPAEGGVGRGGGKGGGKGGGASGAASGSAAGSAARSAP
jgi:RND family efflux transporter MFP subunit